MISALFQVIKSLYLVEKPLKWKKKPFAGDEMSFFPGKTGQHSLEMKANRPDFFSASLVWTQACSVFYLAGDALSEAGGEILFKVIPSLLQVEKRKRRTKELKTQEKTGEEQGRADE